MKSKHKHTPEFKLQVAVEALQGLKTVGELASHYQVHPSQIHLWKKQLKTEGREIFAPGRARREPDAEALQNALYEEIGRLKFEFDWLKKKLPPSVEAKRAMIEPRHERLSLRRQCQLLGWNRASWYYQPAPEAAENLALMRLIDEQYLKTSDYGSRRMRAWLRRQGHELNRKRVQRLMGKMGLEAIYPRRRPPRAGPAHRIYPYLLQGVVIDRPNQVWSTDITSIPMRQGFMYLVAILDGYGRYVLAWQVANTLDTDFCLAARESALGQATPQIFNTEQGVQFTSQAFTQRLERAAIAISMDGRGRALDKIFVERLWRTVKYEDIYVQDYDSVLALEQGLQRYFQFYNQERLHQSLDYQTPAAVHFAVASQTVRYPLSSITHPGGDDVAD